MTIYIDGYKDGVQSHSWLADLFLLDCKLSLARSRKRGFYHLVGSRAAVPHDTKLTYKQIKDAGFIDWLGKEAPRLDYYIVRDYAPVTNKKNNRGYE